MLSNPKHEKFAQHVARGESLSEAARLAGYSVKSARTVGSRLAKTERIHKRVTELYKPADPVDKQIAKAIVVDKLWIIQKLVEIADRCTQLDHYAPGAANKSLELLGKELGMFQDVIQRDTFNLLMKLMGSVVVKYVSDSNVLDRIVADWERISIADTKTLKAMDDEVITVSPGNGETV